MTISWRNHDPAREHQRKKGRDLFDLWFALDRDLLDHGAVVDCFRRYMAHEGASVSRAEFEANLTAKSNDRAFLDEVRPLLAKGVAYDPEVAVSVVQNALVSRLPGDPWKGRRSV